ASVPGGATGREAIRSERYVGASGLSARRALRRANHRLQRRDPLLHEIPEIEPPGAYEPIPRIASEDARERRVGIDEELADRLVGFTSLRRSERRRRRRRHVVDDDPEC